MNDAVLFEKKGAVAEIVLNRPDQMNAMNMELIAGLREAVEKSRDPGVRVVVIRANGRCYCAGGDIKRFHEVMQEGKPIPAEMPDVLHEMIEKIRDLEKPVLASVQGPAAGAGTSLVLACDLVIASEEAVFNLAYGRIGLSPDGSSTYFLPRHVGMKKVMEIFMTMPTLKANEAKDLGLINWVVPAAALKEKTDSIASQLAQGPTQAFGRLKKLMQATYDNNLHDQLALETELICASSKTSDFREGITSFLEKRIPQFQGK